MKNLDGSGLSRVQAALICLATACFALSTNEASGQTATYTESLKPESVAQMSVPPLGLYDSVEQAFAAHKAWQTNPANCGATFTCVVDDLKPCANQTQYYWDEPTQWCWHYKKTQYGLPHSEGTTGGISTPNGCPSTHSRVLNTTGTGTVADPRRTNDRCEQPNKPRVPPNQCGHGNPIYPVSGTKRQVEHDYVSANGILKFTRNYNSDSSRFSADYQVAFIPPGEITSPRCKGGVMKVWDSTIGAYRTYDRCFEPIKTSAKESTATYVGPSGVREEFNWDGANGRSTLPYITNDFVSTTVNAASGWLMMRREENRMLVFDGGGRLVSIQQMEGPRVTLTYDGDNLTTLADGWGRTLQILAGRTSPGGFIDPAGNSVSYAYSDINKLATVTYQDSSKRTYLWDEATLSAGSSPPPNRLTGIIDETGGRYASFGYLNGRAVSTEYAGGANRFAVSDSRSGGAGNIAVTFPSGSTYTTTYALVNGLSRPTSSNQPAGAGCAAATSGTAYDGRGNIARSDDFNGGRICLAHDQVRNLETTRVAGLANAVACASVTPALAVLPTGSRKLSTAWHPELKLTRFRGHPILMEEGVRYADPQAPVSGGVPPTNGRACPGRAHAGAARA